MKPTPASVALTRSSQIVELRRYTLHPGQRDVLINLFEREFVESQEAVGIELIGQFRDADDPNAFVWLRSFPDPAARARALMAFYDEPVWKTHRGAANATMVNSDDVLLLRPAWPASGFVPGSGERPPSGAAWIPSERPVAATVCHLDAPAGEALLDFVEQALIPTLTSAGATVFASLVTEQSANTFPRLPVRENENVLVYFLGFPDLVSHEQHLNALARSERWRDEIAPALAGYLRGAPQTWRLLPTARSRLRGRVLIR